MKLQEEIAGPDRVPEAVVGKSFAARIGASQTRRIAFASFVSWGSRAVAILSGLVLIPVLFRHLGKEELGMWLLLGQSWAVLGIFDFGFGPILARRIAMAKGRSGGDVTIALTSESRHEIADLFFSASCVFKVLAVVTFSIAWVGGYFYLGQLPFHELKWHVALLAWSILCAGQMVSVWTMGWSMLLIGLGYVGWDLMLVSSISLVTIFIQIGIALSGGGLVGLAIIQALSGVVSRVLFASLARRFQPDVCGLRGRWDWQLVKSMIDPSLRCWVTTLGGVLIMQTDQFFVAQSRGAAELPSYRAAYLLCINIQMLAITASSASAPFISQLWQADRKHHAQQLALRNLRFGLAVVLCGLAALMISGNDLFTVWLGPGHFSGYTLLGVFSIIMVFETHSYIITTASRATEDEAFAIWSITAGGLKLVFSYVFLKYFGLLGIALGTLAAQGTTNYWYMGYRGLKRLGVSFMEYALSVFLPLLLVSAIAVLGGLAVKHALADSTAPLRLACVVLTCGAVLAGSCWYLVLDAVQRQRVLLRLAVVVR